MGNEALIDFKVTKHNISEGKFEVNLLVSNRAVGSKNEMVPYGHTHTLKL